MGVIAISQTFPFSLGMGVSRKDYFLGTTSMIGVTSAILAAVMAIMSYIEGDLTVGWGVHLHFFQLPFMNEGPAIIQFFTVFLLLILMFYTGFVISSIHRKFGRNGTLARIYFSR